jgi:carboxylesterase type B
LLKILKSAAPVYNGSQFVKKNEDVTVVSFNYRLNIFGYSNAPQLVNSLSSINLGHLDVKAAINWVYENIEAFGGDPKRIISFGESAGGFAIDAYVFANEEDHIVRGELLSSDCSDALEVSDEFCRYYSAVWNVCTLLLRILLCSDLFPTALA